MCLRGKAPGGQSGAPPPSFCFCTDQLSKMVKSLPSLGFAFSSGKIGQKMALGSREHEKSKKFFLVLNYKKAIYLPENYFVFFDVGSTMNWLLIFNACNLQSY